MEGQYRVPPPPPSYEGQGLAEDKKIEVPDHAGVPDSPMPGQQTRENSSGSFNHSIPPPSYNPPADSRGPYTPGQFDLMSPSSTGSNPPPFMAVCPPGPVPTTPESISSSLPPPTMAVCPPGPNGTPPVVSQLSEKEKKKGVPDWMVTYFLNNSFLLYNLLT
jgi:hypothetical protein